MKIDLEFYVCVCARERQGALEPVLNQERNLFVFTISLRSKAETTKTATPWIQNQMYYIWI